MNASPAAPLIIIDKGEYCGTDISGTTATLADVDDPEYGYYLLGGPEPATPSTKTTSAKQFPPGTPA